MSLFDPHNADPGWQRLFGEATDTPPPRIWEAIERELDDETDALIPVIPFWQRSVFRRVATVAALIALVAGGLLVVQRSEKVSVVVENTPKAHKIKELSTDHVDNYQKSGQNVDKLNLDAPIPKESTPGDLARVGRPKPQQIFVGRNQSTDKATAPTRIASEVSTNQKITPNQRPKVTNERMAESDYPVLIAVKLPEIAPTKSPEITLATPVLHQPLRIELLPSPTLTTVVQVAAHEPAIAPQQSASSAKPRGQWLSVSAGQAAFQPSVALRSQQPSLGVVKGSVPIPDQSLASHAGSAVSVLAVAGFHLSSRWFVEAGAGYQQAQSVVVSPGQTVSSFARANSSSPTLYADALLGFSPSSQSVSNVQTNHFGSINMDTRYQVGKGNEQRSTYQFGQATAQLGYQFRPRKRLGIAALGGLIANLFVKNAVENGPVIRAVDAVYRPVSVAGLGGIRFRYRVSGRWSVSMAGLYQYSLSSITQPGALLSVQPQNVSINGGLDYHF